MLEYLIFSDILYRSPGPFRDIEIWVNQECLFYNCKISIEDKPRVNSKLSKVDSKLWLEKLYALKINTWKSDYSDKLILDGHSWSLEYKIKDKRCRHIHGHQKYPDNYNELIKLMNSLDSKFDLLEI